MPIANRIVDYVDQIEHLDTAYDLFRYTKRLGNDFGASHFSIMSKSKEANQISEIGVVNNWNPELIHLYDEGNLAQGSPILDHLETGNRSIVFDVNEIPQDRDNASVTLSKELFNDFGMTQGIACPVVGASGERGGISFSSSKLELSKDDEYVLHLLANYAFDRLTKQSSKLTHEKPVQALSSQESICLQWIAAGKTAREVAVIMSLSSHTVTHYLTSACKKLDAVNRVQAVAKAIRLGFLS